MKNKINLVLVLAILSVLSIVSVNAVTLISPANSATVSGTYILNATNTSLPYMVNCTFYAKSSLTANSSWTSLGTFTNLTDNPLRINGTFASTGLEDANNYFFNATCRNISNSVSSAASTETIIVDNTVPTAPSSLTPTSDTDGTVSFSATVTGRETTSCVLYFSGTNPGNPSYTMTHSGATCTYDSLSMPEQSYQYYVRASDETNTTNSATTTLNVDVHTSAGAGTVIAQQQATQEQIIAQEQAEQQRNTILIIIGVIVGLVVLYIIVNRWNKFS